MKQKQDPEFLIEFIWMTYSSLQNNYKDNFDKLRFGKLTVAGEIKEKIKDILFSRIILKSLLKKGDKTLKEFVLGYKGELEKFYDILSDNESKELLIRLLTYRILGYRHVKLPVNNNNYQETISFVNKLPVKGKIIKSGFLNWDLLYFDLKTINYNIKLFSNTLIVTTGFILEQYRYKTDRKCVEAKEGDYVIDAGGCWGDTSLYFASKTGLSGKVFSFEFIPNNLEIFRRNVSLNPLLAENITVIDRPLWDSDNKEAYYIDSGPASIVRFEHFPGASGKTKTITIDTFVRQTGIEKINFIKMDIEGAESFALSGAINTIRRFKPTLAIAIYHSMDDFVNIPQWILNLNLGYKLYLGHYTIHLEETILFAVAD